MAVPPRPIKNVVILIVAGAALLVGGGVGGAVLWNNHHHQAASRRAASIAPVKSLPPILAPSNDEPLDDISPHGPDATLVRAGFAQMVVRNEGGTYTYNFTYQNRAHSPLDVLLYTALSRLRHDPLLQQRIALTPDQLAALEELKLDPVFPASARTRLETLWTQYATATGRPARAAARAALLAQLHRAGDELVPAMQVRMKEEEAVLTTEQLVQLKQAATDILAHPANH